MSDQEERRSTSGFIVILGSAPIPWKSRKQRTVSLSSCEAEYIALAEAVKEIFHLQSLYSAVNIKQLSPIILFCNNQGAIALTKEKLKQYQRTNHIDVKYHFIREQKDIYYRYIVAIDNFNIHNLYRLNMPQHKNILLVI